MAGLRHLLLALLLSMTFCQVPCSAGTPIYPLKASQNGRYLVDQSNAPVLLMGDAPQSLVVNLTESEAASFFTNRAGYGFNTLWINLLCTTYTGGRVDASTFDGTLSFTNHISGTGSYDLTTPNEAYFSHMDRLLNSAAQNGLQVLLDPIETGGFLQTMRDNTVTKCRTYGQYLGSRYKGFPNIIWMSGNDFQSWRTAGDDAVARSVALGIQDVDTNHLQTAELDYLVSSSLEDTNWASIFTLNATYTYFPTYAQLLLDYNRTRFLPNFLVEANYEFESLQGPITTAPILRKQEYWTMLSGAAGHVYGNHYTWPFLSGWQNNLATPGALQIQYLMPFFNSRAWYSLIPDTNHIVVTGGYGTFSSSGYVADNNYLTAASTPDGNLVLAYTPVVRQFTVDLSKLTAPAVARWFDPSQGTFVPVSGSPLPNSGITNFVPPGNNGDGDGGWVLALETKPPAAPPPPAPKPKFVQQNYATPQSPQRVVAVGYPAPQGVGNANILAIGWNDTLAAISSVTDTAGNSYQAAVPAFQTNGLSQAIYYALNIPAGSNTVTVSFNQPAAYVDFRATEYSGLLTNNAFEGGASAMGNGTIADSGPVIISSANSLLFGTGITANTFTAPGGGFSLRVITSPDADLVEDQTPVNAGLYHGLATLNSGPWVMQSAAFAAAPSVVAPELSIVLATNNSLVILWSGTQSGFSLQQSTQLETNWTFVTNAAALIGGEYQVETPSTGRQQFYRLIGPTP